MATVEELKSQIAEKTEERNALREEALKLIDEDKVEEASEKREAIKVLDEEISELKKQLEEAEEKENENDNEEVTQVEERAINRVEVPEKVTHEEVRAFENYLETRDIAGGSLTTESGFVVIPEEIVTDIL